MDKLARKLALSSFLGSPGFRLFAEEIGTNVEFNQNEIDKLTKCCVDPKQLCHFNYNLGTKNGMKIVLNILESFKEELKDNSPEQA